MIYAGIGARRTPGNILHAMVGVGEYMSKVGHILRSGGAAGADHAFEVGCDYKRGSGDHGLKEIYLPWRGFNGNDSPYYSICHEAMELAATFHPAWDNLSSVAQKFMGRNCYQILGIDMKTKADFIVCWTPEGRVVGGTGQALRMAAFYRIPIFNLGSADLDTMNVRISNFLGVNP